MSFCCALDTNEYTIENALFWGMCENHFHQAQVETRWLNRVVHVVVAILEALPVIGQIISLLELGIIAFFSTADAETESRLEPLPQPLINDQERAPQSQKAGPRVEVLPQPVSCYPQFTLIKKQERDDDISRYWPSDLTLLGLSEEQKTVVDTHIRDIFRGDGSVSWDKKKFTYEYNNATVSVGFPIALSIRKVNNVFQIMLFSKTEFMSGGERKIRWAYDLTCGAFRLKKRIVGLFEQRIIQEMLRDRKNRGIESSIFWRNTNDKLGNPKVQIIEPVRDGTISMLFGTEALSKFSTKRDLILDCLEDLRALHQILLSDVSVKVTTSGFPRSKVELKIPPYRAYHYDLKFLNLLAFYANGRWRAELCDFGVGVGNPTVWCAVTGFTSPEYIEFYKKQRPFGIFKEMPFEDETAIINFNIVNGQGRDIWGMGLILLAILVGRIEYATVESTEEKGRYATFRIAPLRCLKECIQSSCWSKYKEEGILKLSQQTLDKEIDELQQEVVQKHEKEDSLSIELYFNVVKQMLRISRHERVSSIANLLS